MSSQDFSFMKSGFDNPINQEFELKKQVKELITMYSYNALNSASIYIEHSGRNKILPEDLKRSLMLEIFLFTNRELDKDIIDFKNRLFHEMDPIKEDNDDKEEEEEEEEEKEEFCESKCTCAMCKCLNTIYTRWEKFTLSSPLEEILRDRINEM